MNTTRKCDVSNIIQEYRDRVYRYELIRENKYIEDCSEIDFMKETFSMILKKHLPHLNQIRPYSGIYNSNTKNTNYLQKKNT